MGKYGVFAIFAMCFLGFRPVTSWATPMLEYSADVVSEMHGGNRVFKVPMRVYVAGQKMRTEAIQNGQVESITLLLPDKKRSYQLNPRGHTYMEFPLKPQKSQTVLFENNQTHMRALGDQTIDGIPCHKTAIVANGKIDGTIWKSIATGYPVLFQSADKKLTMHWTNFKPEHQPASLFMIPAGYRKIEMPSIGSMFSHMMPHPSIP